MREKEKRIELNYEIVLKWVATELKFEERKNETLCIVSLDLIALICAIVYVNYRKY